MPSITTKLGATLVVDDDEFVLSVVARMVQKLGAEVVTAADGQTARRILGEARQFDLVICDLKMPGLDGIELLRDFASLQASAALILMSSADAKTLRAAEQVARARQLRILGTLQKPVSSAALNQLIARIGELGQAPAPQNVDSEISVAELRAALEAEEIDVYMQPKIGLRSGRLAGAEALARWLKPDGRILMPSSFVPLAEQNGLADLLTQLVVRKSLAAQQEWRAHGLDIPVSVNLPIDSLDHLDLPEQLSAETARYDTAPDKLILECLRRAVLNNDR